MLFQAVLALLLQALVVFAQTAFPSNATYSQAILSNSSLDLQYGALSTGFPVAFATDLSTGKLSNSSVLQAVLYNSTIQLYGPFLSGSINAGAFAYISCDSPSYTQGNVGFTQTMQAATDGITRSNTYPNTGAIVLYSETSQWCNFTATGGYNYTQVFVLPGRMQALATEGALRGSSVPMIAAIYNTQIVMNGSVVQTGNQNSDGGQTGPSTTVAMVILYSVTGIITICFVLVIVTGALRARRHPERYGLLNLPVGSHQRRARGIARAMLETIPIVKFGEREPAKVPDEERGTELRTIPETEAQNKNEPSLPPAAGISDHTPESVNATAENPSGAESSTASPAGEANVPADLDISDDGLACSVCTDDFVKGQDLRVLPCNHKFHPECIDPWLLNVSGTCPLCRIDLRPPEDREQPAAEPATEPAELPLQPGEHNPGQPFQRYSIFLNRQRLARSTPAQRLRALRDLRNHRRNNTATPSENVANGSPTDEPRSTGESSASAPRSNRVSRLFGRRDGSPPAANNSTSPA